MRKHLAIFKTENAEAILSGKKSIEIRFSKSKRAPFGLVSSGDLVYIKPLSKDIIGQFRVKKVIFFDGLTSLDFNLVKKTFDIKIGDYMGGKIDCKYATLIFIGDSSRFITSPIKPPKKHLGSWTILD